MNLIHTVIGIPNSFRMHGILIVGTRRHLTNEHGSCTHNIIYKSGILTFWEGERGNYPICANKQGEATTTLNCFISVGYHLELRVVIILY